MFTAHGRERAWSRAGIRDIQQLCRMWATAREATAADFDAFLTWQRPGTECRVAVSSRGVFLLVRDVVHDRFVTIIPKRS